MNASRLRSNKEESSELQETNGFEILLCTLLHLLAHQILPCCFDDIFRNGSQFIDLQNTIDLHQQMMNQAKLPPVMRTIALIAS
jgi:hypothetical protein